MPTSRKEMRGEQFMKSLWPRSFVHSLIGLCLAAALMPVLADELPRHQLTAKDGRFTPETIEVPAGKKFRLVVTNAGPSPEEFESHELNREKVIPAGSKVEIIIGPLQPGSYSFFGDFHPETAKGQIVAK
jgi:Cupredoxin-like domain